LRNKKRISSKLKRKNVVLFAKKKRFKKPNSGQIYPVMVKKPMNPGIPQR
jgi:hypothetical protein